MSYKLPNATCQKIAGAVNYPGPLLHPDISLSFFFASPDYCTQTEPDSQSAWLNMQVGSKARGLVRVLRAPTFLNSNRFLSHGVPAIDAPSHSSRQQWRPHSAFSSQSLPFSGTFLIFSLLSFGFGCWENDGRRNWNFEFWNQWFTYQVVLTGSLDWRFFIFLNLISRFRFWFHLWYYIFPQHMFGWIVLLHIT